MHLLSNLLDFIIIIFIIFIRYRTKNLLIILDIFQAHIKKLVDHANHYNINQRIRLHLSLSLSFK
jgi:hypothetical protein